MQNKNKNNNLNSYPQPFTSIQNPQTSQTDDETPLFNGQATDIPKPPRLTNEKLI